MSYLVSQSLRGVGYNKAALYMRWSIFPLWMSYSSCINYIRHEVDQPRTAFLLVTLLVHIFSPLFEF